MRGWKVYHETTVPSIHAISFDAENRSRNITTETKEKKKRPKEVRSRRMGNSSNWNVITGIGRRRHQRKLENFMKEFHFVFSLLLLSLFPLRRHFNYIDSVVPGIFSLMLLLLMYVLVWETGKMCGNNFVCVKGKENTISSYISGGR